MSSSRGGDRDRREGGLEIRSTYCGVNRIPDP